MTKTIECYSLLNSKFATLDFNKQKVVFGCDYFDNFYKMYRTVHVLFDQNGEHIIEGGVYGYLNNIEINFMIAMVPSLIPFLSTDLKKPNVSIVNSEISSDWFFIEFQINDLAPIFRYLKAPNELPLIDYVRNLDKIFRFSIPIGRKSIGFSYKDEYPVVNFFGPFESFIIDAVRSHAKVRIPLLYQ